MNKETIVKDLTVIRKRCVKYVNSVRSRITDFDPHDLSCMCASASLIISKFYEDKGVDVNIHYGYFGKFKDCHCWVKIGDYYGDITASQFGKKDVIVRKRSIGTTKRIFRGTLQQKYKQLKDDDWDKSQLLLPSEVKRIVKGIKL